MSIRPEFDFFLSNYFKKIYFGIRSSNACCNQKSKHLIFYRKTLFYNKTYIINNFQNVNIVIEIVSSLH